MSLPCFRTPIPEDELTRSASLVRDWRQASYSSAWSHAEEWWTPAVDAVAEAIVDSSGDARAACENLGRQRAAAGVFLDEARADVLVAAQVAGLSSELAAGLVDRLTLGWVDRTLDTFFTSACIDPITELASLPYLMTRITEMYAEAGARGGDLSEEQAFVVVQVLMAADLVDGEMQMMLVQQALRRAFNRGETLSRIGPQCAVAVVRREEPRLSYALGQLRGDLEHGYLDGGQRRTRMWLERLPRDRELLPALIRHLND